MATYLDCRDRLSLDEVLDIAEILTARVENEWRAHEAASGPDHSGTQRLR